ncbi:zinc metalloprotease HtpX [Taklimakanibacter albus]|uniref:M48 family metalloprotease n=1 Tax=Taklimakanibacter albus TaxID=2800327 RepID=A0ACC5QY64_9HYPH|nr:zinc metalloprotease HtpX [Aestuariivirga sp. YIM B02566]MBK1865308.1 M48 family metalloprotease [Aestuariivirga sp. YIM B02566]
MPRPHLNLALQRSHDLRNALHTAVLIGGSAVLVAAIAWTVLGFTGLVWAAILGAIGLWTMGRVSPKMVLGLYKARALSPDELPDVHHVVRELARRADLPSVPQLYYVPSKILNAFAVGTPQDSAIAVTDGLVRTMTMRQLAGILAHETAHIKSGDLKVMALADVLTRITSSMSFLGLIGIPALFGAGIAIPWLGILLLIFAPTLGGLLQLGLSRTREYDADLDGAALTGDPAGLASALETLEHRQGRVWEGLFPAGRVPSPSLLRTHPATEDRMRRLLALAGEPDAQIALTTARPVPGPSLVPPIRNPRIHWHRMGIWY